MIKNNKPSLYEEISKKNLKLIRKIDQLDLAKEKILKENVEMQEKLKKMNFSINSTENYRNSLKPTISVLIFLIIMWSSLLGNLLHLNNLKKKKN